MRSYKCFINKNILFILQTHHSLSTSTIFSNNKRIQPLTKDTHTPIITSIPYTQLNRLTIQQNTYPKLPLKFPSKHTYTHNKPTPQANKRPPPQYQKTNSTKPKYTKTNPKKSKTNLPPLQTTPRVTYTTPTLKNTTNHKTPTNNTTNIKIKRL